MRRRKRFVGPALALAAALLASCNAVMSAWQDASNVDMKNRIAPALESTVWIHSDKGTASPTFDGRWTLLVFFDSKARATEDCLARASALQDTYRDDRFVVFGITEVDLEKTAFFLEDHAVSFSTLADARVDRIAFGIKNLWAPVVYLVDPYARIVAEGLDEAAEMLQEKFGH